MKRVIPSERSLLAPFIIFKIIFWAKRTSVPQNTLAIHSAERYNTVSKKVHKNPKQAVLGIFREFEELQIFSAFKHAQIAAIFFYTENLSLYLFTIWIYISCALLLFPPSIATIHLSMV